MDQNDLLHSALLRLAIGRTGHEGKRDQHICSTPVVYLLLSSSIQVFWIGLHESSAKTPDKWSVGCGKRIFYPNSVASPKINSYLFNLKSFEYQSGKNDKLHGVFNFN
jgi:hypothetical protein